MRADDVIMVLDMLDEAGVRHWVGGGWGVAALTGRQTREHRDLDLAVDADGHGRQPDLDGGHFDYPPAAFTTGSIGGRAVPCLSAQQQRRFRLGYEHHQQDAHDLAELDALQDEPKPPEQLGYDSPDAVGSGVVGQQGEAVAATEVTG